MKRFHAWALAPALLLAADWAAYAQPRVIDQLPDEDSFAHGAGKSVQPFFEGWQTMPDGHIAMWFGYLNLNYEEEPDIAVGPNNKFDLRDDLGQPTHFYPRRHLFVFKVDLPKDWDKQKHLVWSITTGGHTNSANGWLQPEWEVDEGVMQMNIGPGGAPPVDPPNLAPKVSAAAEVTAEAGKPVALSASASDDGIPKPRARARAAASAPRMPLPPGATPPPRAQLGLRIRWELYRAPAEGGSVEFEPESNQPQMGAESSELKTQAVFSVPGTYWLRAVASDGMLETPYDVKVTVKR
ncbi:MAG TPA: hypothetical protein VKX49_06500 [Bryobacteraceae bacterium]|nr:hypothetical protein [Bryobacteraceae bacterium]